MQTTVVGSYPRVSDAPDGQRLRRAIARWERKEISREDLRAVQVDVLREVVREQASAGVDVVADGQVTWYDPVSQFAAKLDGFEIGPLERYFDTNTYYRQPKAVGPIRWRAPMVADDFKEAVAATSRPVKAVLTGPYTLAAMSANGPSDDLVMQLAEALGREVEALAAAGATQIQIDEPAFARVKTFPKMYGHLAGLLLKRKGRARTTIFIAFGGVGPFLEDLLMLPFDVVGLDLVQGAATLAALRTAETDKGIGFGLLDARNTKLEDPKAVAKTVASLGDRVPLDRSYLCPSNGLEFLPRTRARQKLNVLVAAAKLVTEGAG